jgi:hypothetical protein
MILACLAVSLALYLRKKRNHRWTKEWYKGKPKYTRENLLRHFRLSERNDKSPLRLDGLSFCELLKISIFTIGKTNVDMREVITHSQCLSITLHYLAIGNTFEDLKFSFRTCLLLGRET